MKKPHKSHALKLAIDERTTSENMNDEELDDPFLFIKNGRVFITIVGSKTEMKRV